MYCKRFRLAAGVVVAFAMVLATTARPALGEEPGPPVKRTFGFFATGSLVGPDFLSDDSKVVTVLPDAASPAAGEPLDFSTTEANPEGLGGSHWVSVPAHHATKHNEPIGGVFFWLLNEDTPDLPPVGANAVTGANGMILDQVSYRIARCNGDCNFGEDQNSWRVAEGEGTGTPFVVVTALFSR